MPRDTQEITVETLLMAYASGVFPMAETRDDPEIHWIDPTRRGILPLDGLHLSRSLARTIRRGRFAVTVDAAFDAVVEGCADREETWINPAIARLYGQLHRMGFAHSLEVWEEGALAGGLYGVTLAGAFFGESMFSRRTDASKVALAHAVALLRRDGFVLFDTQFLTEHLQRMGGIEVSRRAYHLRLRDALAVRGAQWRAVAPQSSEVMHLRSQTS